MDGLAVLVEGLAHCDGVDMPAVLAQVPDEVGLVSAVAHPDVVRTPELVARCGKGQARLARAVSAAGPGRVREELLHVAPSRVVRSTVRASAGQIGMAQAVQAALAADTSSAWVVLQLGPQDVREQMLAMLADQAGSSLTCALTWLAGFVKGPVGTRASWPGLPQPLASYVAHLAEVGGARAAAELARDVFTIVVGQQWPAWAQDLSATSRIDWAAAVAATGLAPVAELACRYVPDPGVWRAVLTHPHLAGQPVVEHAVTRVRAVVATLGAPGASVWDGAAVLAADRRDVHHWVADSRDRPDQVALAWAAWWAWWRSLLSGVSSQHARQVQVLEPGLTLAAAGGGVGVTPVQLEALLEQARAADWALDGWVGWLVQTAQACCTGPGVGGVLVSILVEVWERTLPMWLGRAVGQVLTEAFAGCSPAERASAVRVLLDLGGDFPGTLADLAATARALAAP